MVVRTYFPGDFDETIYCEVANAAPIPFRVCGTITGPDVTIASSTASASFPNPDHADVAPNNSGSTAAPAPYLDLGLVNFGIPNITATGEILVINNSVISARFSLCEAGFKALPFPQNDLDQPDDGAVSDSTGRIMEIEAKLPHPPDSFQQNVKYSLPKSRFPPVSTNFDSLNPPPTADLPSTAPSALGYCPEGCVLRFQPAMGVIPPLSSVLVTVTYTPTRCERLRTLIECHVQDMKEVPLLVRLPDFLFRFVFHCVGLFLLNAACSI